MASSAIQNSLPQSGAATVPQLAVMYRTGWAATHTNGSLYRERFDNETQQLCKAVQQRKQPADNYFLVKILMQLSIGRFQPFWMLLPQSGPHNGSTTFSDAQNQLRYNSRRKQPLQLRFANEAQ